MSKKFLSLFISLILLTGLIPNFSYADTGETDPELSKPLCFTAVSGDASVQLYDCYEKGNFTIQYSSDNHTWLDYIVSSDSKVINLASGDSVYFRAKDKRETMNSSRFKMGGSGMIAASGNIMYLLDPSGNSTTITEPDAFYRLFLSECLNLISAPKLPATKLSKGCYAEMFEGCENLKEAPELPAKELAEKCYYHMFDNCKKLRQAPELSSKIMKKTCYTGMFAGCDSLEKSPELPARELAQDCYAGMFSGCASLTSAPELPAAIMEEHCYSDMFSECHKLEYPPKLPSLSLAPYCYYGMFRNCTQLKIIPVLPATIVPMSAYFSMFEGCRSLESAKEIYAQHLEIGSIDSMFRDCINLEELYLLYFDNDFNAGLNMAINGCINLSKIAIGRKSQYYTGNVNYFLFDCNISSNGTLLCPYEFDTNIEQWDGSIGSILPEGWHAERFARIDFVTNSSNEIGRQAVMSGDSVKQPPEISKPNCEFAGWYEDEELTKPYNFKTIPRKSYTLYAKWIPATGGKDGKDDGKEDKSSDAKAISISSTLTSFVDSTNGRFIYTGKAIEPKIQIKHDGKVLQEGKDYTLTYRNNIEVGTGEIVVTGKDKYSGSTVIKFTIKPQATGFKSLKGIKKGFKVKVKKSDKANSTGYRLRYSLNKDMSKSKKLYISKKFNKTTRTVKKLKSKKTYYVQVRTVKKVDGYTYCSPWSKVRKVRTK